MIIILKSMCIPSFVLIGSCRSELAKMPIYAVIFVVVLQELK